MAKVLLPFDHFHIDSVEDFRAKAGRAGYRLPVSEDLEPLRQPVTAGGRNFHNALAVQPLEGIDAREDGSPSELALAAGMISSNVVY